MSKRRTRRRFTAEFKGSVAMEAARGIKTVSEVADENKLHPVQVRQWKKESLDSVHTVFEKDRKDARQESEASKKSEARLERKVGQLSIELDWLQKEYRYSHPRTTQPTPAESLLLLNTWKLTAEELEKQFAILDSCLDTGPESKLNRAAWDIFEDYTSTLAALIGDENEWL